MINLGFCWLEDNRRLIARLFAIFVCLVLTLSLGVGAAQNVVRSSTYLGQLRFSPDGRYVLGQDDAEITVLTAPPLAILFRIPAVRATPAQFTPDSAEVVFLSSVPRTGTQASEPEKPTPHLERWSIAGRDRVGFFEAPATGCGTLVLSPDGRVLACNDSQGTLKLVDVPARQTLYEKRQFVRLVSISAPDEFRRLYAGDLGKATIDFSPDGHYLRASASGGDSLLWDVRGRTAVRFLGALRSLRSHPLSDGVFLAPNRIILLAGFSSEFRIAKLVSFPDGQVLSTQRIPMGRVLSATDPDFVLIRPLGRAGPTVLVDPSAPMAGILPNTHRLILRDPLFEQRTAAVDLSTGHVIESKQSLIDVHGPYYVAQPSPDEVGLYDREKGIQAVVTIHPK
jgi:hypothetical protein